MITAKFCGKSQFFEKQRTPVDISCLMSGANLGRFRIVVLLFRKNFSTEVFPDFTHANQNSRLSMFQSDSYKIR